MKGGGPHTVLFPAPLYLPREETVLLACATLPCPPYRHTTMVKQLPVLTGTALKGRVLTACIAMVAGMGEFWTPEVPQ